MKSLFVVAALCGIWMSVEGVSVMTPHSKMWDKNAIMQLQNECVAKLQNDETIVLSAAHLKLSYLTVFLAITQNVRRQNSLDSLDTMIDDICVPAVNEDQLYNLLMQITKTCMDQDDTLTPEEKQMVKSKLKRIFCNIYIKLTAIIAFSPECVSNLGGSKELEKCAPQTSFNPYTSPKDWFVGETEMCTTQSKAIDCVTDIFKGECDDNVSSKIQSVMAEAKSIFGCDVEPNSIAVVNSL